MSKYELSLSKDYVPDWTLVDAVRELFQNAIDQETTQPDNKMFFRYIKEEQRLEIGNKKSVLETRSLLLGASTKVGDKDTIGQFGEGYKIATLVITRLGKTITFWNYGAKEVWRPRFVNSKRYGAEILTFFVDKKYAWQSVPNDNLCIVVEGVTEDEYDLIVESNLHLQTVGDTFITDSGRILLDERFVGKVFVNGLYVCNYKDYSCGYDFKPGKLQLDRDRKLASDFHLKWLASEMWVKATSDAMVEKASELIAKGASDTKFVTDVYVDKSGLSKISDDVHTKFVKEHGDKAVPVSTHAQLVALSEEHKPVMVTEELQKVIVSSTNYVKPAIIEQDSYAKRLRKWFNEYNLDIGSGNARLELEVILTHMEEAE